MYFSEALAADSLPGSIDYPTPTEQMIDYGSYFDVTKLSSDGYVYFESWVMGAFKAAQV